MNTQVELGSYFTKGSDNHIWTVFSKTYISLYFPCIDESVSKGRNFHIDYWGNMNPK